VAGVWEREGRVEVDGQLLALSAERPAFRAEVAGREVSGRLFLQRAPDGREIPIPDFSRSGRDGDAWRAQVAWQPRAATDLPQARLRLELRVRQVGAWAGVEVVIRNGSGEQALVEVGWRAEAAMTGAEHWGGMTVRPAGARYETVGLRGPYPLTTVADDQACLAMGYDPGQWLSYLRNAADVTGTPVTLETSARVVVDAGEAESVAFVLGVFPTSWRHLEALDQYYEAFPRWFRPLPGMDRRASLNGGSYLLWNDKPDGDLARRLQVGWEWCYAPFKRTGDIYGRQESWDYEPVRPQKGSRSLTLDEFHAWRKSRFEAGASARGLMGFYVPSQIWCEERLARERYSDSLTTDPTVKTYFDTPWVTGADNELRVFPLNTSFGEQSRRDMKELIEELGLQAFAFDTADGGARYYGPAVDACPGRAWDERGVFVEEGVAIGSLMDWVHEQRQGGKPLAVVANYGAYSTFVTCHRCDSAMLEADPTTVASGVADGLRYRLGHKTMVFWETYEYPELLRDDLTREQYVDALRGIAEWTVLACLREVTIPTPRIALGLTPVVHWLPLLAEMAQAGWEPIPAATRSDGAWVSRAGRRWRCYLATGNETGEEVRSTLEVDDARIGPRHLLWVRLAPDDGDGRAVEHVVGESGTELALALQPREPIVLRPVAALPQAPPSLRARVAMAEHLDKTTVTMDFSGPRGKATLVMPRGAGIPRRDLYLKALRVDGKAVALRSPEDPEAEQDFQLVMPCRVEAVYASNDFYTDRGSLQGFPRREGDRMSFDVALAADGPGLEEAARRLVDYFPSYYAAAADPPVKLEPPTLVRPGQLTSRPVVRLAVDPSLPSARRVCLQSAECLEIAGRTPEDLETAVNELLAVWDEVFFYPGPLPAIDMFRRVGLAGKPLP